MDSLDKITLKAFLAALMRLDSSLPADLQNQLNKIGKTLSSDVSKLHIIAKNYAPLAQEYMDARLALQKDGERLRFTIPESANSTQIRDEALFNFAIDALNGDDSVDLVKKKGQESSELGKLLFALQRQTSFMVTDASNIPEEQQWIFSDHKAWNSLERGLRQAAAGEVHYLGDFSQYAGLEIED